MPISAGGARLSLRRFLIAALVPLAAQAQTGTQPASQSGAQARVAGTVELVEGLARVEGKDGSVRTPAAGQTVNEGDTVTTLSDSEVHLQMADGALFMVRERTRVTITEYVADGGDKDRSLMDLAEGALRAITGWIGAYNRNNYRVRTPLVTIGVRGTDHEPTHIPIGDPRGQPGSYDKVNEGAAFMETKTGRVEVPKSRVVFLASSAKAPPRLLDATPKFFRPGRHEQRFVARSKEVRRTIPQQRFERQEFVRQQGAKAGAPGMQKAAPGAQKAVPGGALPGDASPKARAAGKWQDKPGAAKTRQGDKAFASKAQQADKAFANKAREADRQKPAPKPQATGRAPKDAHGGKGTKGQRPSDAKH